MKHRTLKGAQSEGGQAFMELVFILPLFFILIGGVITIFAQLMRIASEAHGSFALVSSQATFSNAERNAGGWINPLTKHKEGASLPESLVETVLNAKKYTHPDAIDRAIVVAVASLENKESEKICAPQFSLGMPAEESVNEKSQFSIKTCAGQSGFENKGTEFIPREGDVERKYHFELEGVQRNTVASALYLPQKIYSYPARGNFAGGAFLGKSNEFVEKFASTESKKSNNFVQMCHMDYLKNDTCKESKRAGGIAFEQTPYDMLENTRQGSSNVQFFACWAEACKSCATFVHMAAEAVAILSSWEMGQEYSGCSGVNKGISAMHKAAVQFAEARSSLVKEKEFEQLMLLGKAGAQHLSDFGQHKLDSGLQQLEVLK